MKTGKVLLIGSAAVVAGILLYGYKKAQDFSEVFDKMKIYPAGISNIKFGLQQITFDLDVSLKNNSSTAFSLSGVYIAKLKRIVISNHGDYIATANVNLEAIEIPALTTRTITNIPVVANLGGLLMNILQNPQLSVEQLGITAVFEVLGTEYTIEN